jgi:hypothetical protein
MEEKFFWGINEVRQEIGYKRQSKPKRPIRK